MAKSTKPKQGERSENLAKKIWLAGIGAYGKSVEDRKEQFDRAGQEATRLFNELVSKGQEIEDQTRAQFDEARDRLSRDARERIEGARDRIVEARERISDVAESNTRSVEELISRVRERMGFDSQVIKRLDALSERVEELSESVAEVLAASGRTPPKRKARSAAKATKAAVTRNAGKSTAAGRSKSASRARPKAKRKTAAASRPARAKASGSSSD